MTDRVWYLTLTDTIDTRVVAYEVGSCRMTSYMNNKLTKAQFKAALRSDLDVLIFDMVEGMYSEKEEAQS